MVDQQEDSVSSASPLVTMVTEEPGRKIEINDSKLKVVTINNKSCSLWALLDTGSPISLIRPSVCKKIFNSDFFSYNLNNSISHNSLSRIRFKGISNVPIEISGLISTSIVLQVLASLVASCSRIR